MAYTLPPLPYDFNGLEPVISEDTLKVHYGKHHQAYCDKLNKVCEDLNINYDQENLKVLLGTIDSDTSPGLRNNLGGFVNHNLYWENLAPKGTVKMSERMEKIWIHEAGSIENFKKNFVDLGMSQFGSGWAWFALRKDRSEIPGITTLNQDHPLMPKVIEEQGHTYYPILTIDLWEHAYYLDYQSSRKEYLEQIFDLVNWDVVEARLMKLIEDKTVHYDLSFLDN